MPRRLRQEDIVTLGVLAEKGQNHCEIAHTRGVSESTVRDHLRRAARELRRKPPFLSGLWTNRPCAQRAEDRSPRRRLADASCVGSKRSGPSVASACRSALRLVEPRSSGFLEGTIAYSILTSTTQPYTVIKRKFRSHTTEPRPPGPPDPLGPGPKRKRA